MKILTYIFIVALLGFPFYQALDWLKVDENTRHFVTPSGKAIILHGINAVYKTPPWIPNSQRWHVNDSLSEKDADDLAAWGFNIVRLGVMWPGVRPSRGYTNYTYLAEVEKIIDMLASKGIYTLVDFHQDLLSRYFCGEGVPDYLIEEMLQSKHPLDFPRPIMKKFEKDEHGYPPLEQCKTAPNFAVLYLSDAVNVAFGELTNLTSPLNCEFNLYWHDVAKYFANNPNVIGYDLFNEPFGGNAFKDHKGLLLGYSDYHYLTPLYEQLRDTIRKVDKRHILFFEPAGTSVNLYAGFQKNPGGGSQTAFSYHVYCPLVTTSGVPRSKFVCKWFEVLSMYLRNVMMNKIKVAGLITEMGAVDESEGAIEELDRVLNLADQALHGWIYWSYKDFSDLTTVNVDCNQGFYYVNDGSLQKKKLRMLTRPYARAIAGKPLLMRFDSKTAKFELEYIVSGTVEEYETEVYLDKNSFYDNEDPVISINTEGVKVEAKGPIYKFIHEGVAAGTRIVIKIEKQ